MTNNQLTEAEITETLDAATSGYPLTASAEANLRRVFAELQERRKAEMGSKPVAWLAIYHGEVYDEAIGITRSVVEAQADRFGWESALTEIIPLYRHAQPAPVVPDEVTAEYCPALVKYDVTEVDEAWARGFNACRAAMLQAEPVTTANKLGNSPVIPDGLIAAVNRLLDSDGSRGCYSAIQCGDAHDEIERLLAAAPQEVK